MRITYSSVHISKANFIFVPMLNFHEKWNDEKLYKHFGLTEYEIELVEKTMRVLNVEQEDIGKDFSKTRSKL